MEFVQVKCPNCGVKIKINKDKKYQDCPECKFEFRTEDVLKDIPPVQPTASISLAERIKQNLKN